MNKLGITIGDVAGVGPEIIVGGWSEIMRLPNAAAAVYGHPEVLRRAVQLLHKNIEVVETETPFELEPSQHRIPCIRCCDDNVLQVPPAATDKRSGEAAYRAIIRAITDAKNKRIDAVVTAPIHKEALNLAGHLYPGHTEIFAEQCGIDNFAMMLYLAAGDNISGKNGLAVVHVTLHTAMKTIFDIITIENVLAKIKLADNFMRKIMKADDSGQRNLLSPSIGVCSLNPHSGEGGLFGNEEIEIIRPAVECALKEGLQVKGPQPADTIMLDARDGKFDAVVAMFHDQGHIALKLLGMHRAVNITLGLPIIRTSVAHGTAFDKSWKGIAETGSLIEACRVAAKMI
ncbi:MAG: 4-hydroxythreonine-4-phosphate dehydrogenase PdxA [Planctomycetaceae bacterium]|nr:4-hydroxythreonine-4-phosphate dehydrogenase PdxA [Planctomycetaceae bacterium]